MASTIEIFCCYARNDQSFLKHLRKHLTLFQKQGLINLWYDVDISPGTNWEEEIQKHLETAQIVLLLISPDFIASDYCYSKEMKRALERHDLGEARVIPIILRPVHWQRAPFGKLQALPKDAKPVKSWRDQDKAFVDVVTGILIAIEQLTMPSLDTIEAILVKPSKTPEVASIKTTDSILTSAPPQLSAISITPSASPTVSEGNDTLPALKEGEQAYIPLPDWDDLPPLNEQVPAALPDWDDLPPLKEDGYVPEPLPAPSKPATAKDTAISRADGSARLAEVVPGNTHLPSLTVQQVIDAWERVKKRTNQKNGLAAATLTRCKIVAIEGTDEESVVVLQFPSETYYKIISNRLKDVEWALTTEFGLYSKVRLLPPGSPSLTVEQVKSVWDKVRKRAKQKNGLVAATLTHCKVIAVEGTDKEPVVVLHLASEAHYKIVNDRSKDVEWALTTEFGQNFRIRLLPPGNPSDHFV